MRVPAIHRLAAALLLAVAACATAQQAGQAEPAYTLRIVNGRGGPIQVHLGASGSWVTLGHVLVPASRTAPGFGAARWAQRNSVAATAVHGIRIKVGRGEFPDMISLVPREFTKIPDFYGGHIPGDSGIRTDIGSGKSLFREWAPLAGSPVSLEMGGGGRMPLPEDYKPAAGDVLLINVSLDPDAPREIVFENRKEGAVTASSPGREPVRIGTVRQPVLGVGRFDGTSYTGVGSINTNHPGVITVSTAPVVNTSKDEGAPPERRGGFMISPANHVGDQAKGMPQVMGVAPLPDEPSWEGRFPLFGGAIGLLRNAASPASGYHVDMQVDGGPWEPLPAIVGKDSDAFTAAGIARYRKSAGPVKEGVTAFRLALPAWDDTAARARLEAARKAAPPRKPEPTGVYRLVKGSVPVEAKGASGSVTFLVDGAIRAASNDPRFRWTWDTTKDRNGRHWLEVVTRGPGGSERRQLQRVLVQN